MAPARRRSLPAQRPQRRTGRVAAQTADARPLDGGLRPCGDAPAYAHGADLVQTRGYLPEQAANWNFIYDRCRALAGKGGRPRLLNLFAYTGGATLAARAAGAETTHVDSVRQVVTWARENMELSGLDGVRWIVEDAMKFVRREVRRGSRYDAIVLDPPAYGRGTDGEKWILEEHIGQMLACCARSCSRPMRGPSWCSTSIRWDFRRCWPVRPCGRRSARRPTSSTASFISKTPSRNSCRSEITIVSPVNRIGYVSVRALFRPDVGLFPFGVWSASSAASAASVSAGPFWPACSSRRLSDCSSR